jgi:hypothetical protein
VILPFNHRHVSHERGQGDEQQPSKLKVAGSNPAGVANIMSCLER